MRKQQSNCLVLLRSRSLCTSSVMTIALSNTFSAPSPAASESALGHLPPSRSLQRHSHWRWLSLSAGLQPHSLRAQLCLSYWSSFIGHLKQIGGCKVCSCARRKNESGIARKRCAVALATAKIHVYLEPKYLLEPKWLRLR